MQFISRYALSNKISSQPLTYHQGKRLFIKDITHYLVPPSGKPATIAPSLGGEPVNTSTGVFPPCSPQDLLFPASKANIRPASTSKTPYPYPTKAEPGNPTVVPLSLLKTFHFTFLIRHPRYSIPSYYRCTIPPLSHVTGFHNFMPSEAGYDELRRVFDYLKDIGQVGPKIAGQAAPEGVNGTDGKEDGNVSITVIDADDLLDNPEGIVKAYCKEVGIDL